MVMLWRTTVLSAMLLAAPMEAALAQGTPGAATRFTNWACIIDLKDALGTDFDPSRLPAEMTTTRTEKLCPGSQPTNVSITCDVQLPSGSWTLGNRNYSGFACQMFLGQCGAPGFVLAPSNNTRLNISASGAAKLTCSAN